MTTFFLTLIVLLLVVLGMALGVILRGKPIKGSCGGIASLGMGKACEICGGDSKKCDKETKANEPVEDGANLAYDAAKK